MSNNAEKIPIIDLTAYEEISSFESQDIPEPTQAEKDVYFDRVSAALAASDFPTSLWDIYYGSDDEPLSHSLNDGFYTPSIADSLQMITNTTGHLAGTIGSNLHFSWMQKMVATPATQIPSNLPSQDLMTQMTQTTTQWI